MLLGLLDPILVSLVGLVVSRVILGLCHVVCIHRGNDVVNDQRVFTCQSMHTQGSGDTASRRLQVLWEQQRFSQRQTLRTLHTVGQLQTLSTFLLLRLHTQTVCYFGEILRNWKLKLNACMMCEPSMTWGWYIYSSNKKYRLSAKELEHAQRRKDSPEPPASALKLRRPSNGKEVEALQTLALTPNPKSKLLSFGTAASP